MNLTADQQLAVTHRGSNLLVAASAGSGKTEVLARRCVDLVADTTAPCGVDELLVVTFTRAAAAELRVRIGRMLRTRADATDDRALRRHLHRQQLLLDSADIGTIDAWCQRVVRVHFDTLEIDPAFAILDEQQAALLRRDTLDELMRWVYDDDAPAAQTARDWIGAQLRPDDKFLRDAISSLNRFRERLPDDAAWLAAQHEFWSQDAQALRDAAEARIGEAIRDECAFQLSQLPSVLRRVEDSRLTELFGLYADMLDAWAAAAVKPGRLVETLEAIGAARLRKPSRLDDDDTAVLEEVRDDWLKRRLQSDWSPDLVATTLEPIAEVAKQVLCLLDLEARFHEVLETAKRQRAAYEFGDILRLSLRLLADGHEHAEALRQRYRHILVDEYQDTSPLQVHLLRSLTRPAPGNRFMVGDIKQSIYGFRDAEPRLFARQVGDFETGREPGQVVPLRDNFRSHARLVDAINRIFALLFDPQLGGTRYDDTQRLRARRDERENLTLDARPRVDVWVLDPPAPDHAQHQGDPQQRPEERIEREARLIAAEIRRMIAGCVQIPGRDAAGDVTLRPLAYSDIVVLLRSARVNAALIAAVLRQAGIPCVASGRESLLDSREVQDVRNVLSLLANRNDDIALAGYLRGPMVELSEPELLAVRRAFADEVFATAALRYAEQRDDALAGRLRTALARLDAWTDLSRAAELPVLLRRIVRDTGLDLFALGLPGGPYRAAVLEAFEALAHDFATRQQGGVSEFVEYLDALDGDGLEPAVAVATSQNVVRIMTIHASKGLEFPVVFLAGAGRRFSSRPHSGTLLCDAASGIGLQTFDAATRCDRVSYAHPIVKRQIAATELGEELRLLYVGATRARERLIVVGHLDATTSTRARQHATAGDLPLISRLVANSMLEWVLMATLAAFSQPASGDTPPLFHIEHIDETRLAELANVPAETADASPDELDEQDQRWIEQAERMLRFEPDGTLSRLPAVISVSTLKAAAAEADDHREHEPALPTALGVPMFAETDTGIDGRLRGTAVHRLLELADLRRLARRSGVEAEVRRLLEAGRLEPEQATLIDLDAIVWLASSEIGPLLAGPGVRREVPLIYALPLRDTPERMIVRGIIDCLVETDGGLAIIDYKTDQVAGNELRQRADIYARQLQLYAIAAGALFARPVSRAVLAFLSARALVEVPITEAALAPLRQIDPTTLTAPPATANQI